MDKLEKKLHEIMDLLKKMPLMPTPSMPKQAKGDSVAAPKPPKAPSLQAKSKKDPNKVVQQLKNPKFDDMKPKEIKDIVSIAGNGQWSLDKKPVLPK